MKIVLRTACLAVTAAALVGCDTGPKGSAGFSLPEGDVEQGKANYVALGCNACHTHPEIPLLEDAGSGVSVKLGGESARVRTYGELVTSVINPSHRVARRSSMDVATATGESRMVSFNDVMTVTQLIDLVAFLQSSYTLSPHTMSAYPTYWYPEAGEEKN